ncbi:MAG TPA: hypothetical protein VNV16_10960 [Methylibium sp.]|nr:hypothetical protein [Methylibium sp.]
MVLATRPFEALRRGWRTVCRVLRRSRTPAGWTASEPADLGTAFGLDAAIEAARPRPR